ncbi:MAG: hypothetical protein FJX66_08640 [Alphaproteobacteria bacterium]|nr:hypothetical protein [Alphaproteobacteria bacterium]
MQGGAVIGVAALIAGADMPASAAEGAEIKRSPGTEIQPHDPNVFGPDPLYEDTYDVEEQLKIYGGKTAFPVTRPLIEAGRELYQGGPIGQGGTALGELNPTFNEFYIYGDWRTAIAFNDNGDREVGLIATRLNLDVDYRFTSTERIHAFFGPFEKGGDFVNCQFFGNDGAKADESCDEHIDGNVDALFFEGDLGPILQGISGEYNNIDLPFAFGLMPLLFQNGIWIEDAFTGLAASVPALNSPVLDISNMDFTFFVGVDNVTTPAIKNEKGKNTDHNVNIFGATFFLEALQGYWEGGLAYIDGEEQFEDESYASFTLALTKRYFGRISNSMRVVATSGQDRDNNLQQTADGVIFLVENSLITSLPSTLVPYANFFVGLDRPQSAARAGGAGGILKNTGINFETDGLTGFPKLDDTGHNTFGGAIGLQYLFNLDQQIVVEVATNQVIEGDNEGGRSAKGNEYAIGLRYQLPLTENLLLRADAMHGLRDQDDDLTGARVELRRKF